MAVFRPEPMQRTVIIASRGYQKTVIETLHSLNAAHIVDFTEGRGGELEGFRIGRPLAEAGTVSERLVRLRGLIRHLGLEGAGTRKSFPVREIEDTLGHALFTIEQDVLSTVEARARVQTELDALAEEETRLRPLRSVPLAIEDYSGYENLEVFVGQADDGLVDELRSVVPEALHLTGEDGFFALFVPKPKAEAANDVLYKHGYREHPVPVGTGSVPERLSAIERSRADLEARRGRAESDLLNLTNRHGDFLIAAEEHLSIEIAKAEAPLSFATTENAFAVDAWVPESRVKEISATLHNATNGNVHLEIVPHVAKPMHGMDDAYGGHDGGEAHARAEREQPPTKLDNPGASRQFQFFTEMFSVPKYDEVDPTLVLSIAFPLFFGFMIGDLGLGLVMALLGWTMFRKLGHIEGLKELGFAILIAGVVAAAFGGLMFKDAFGIPLGSNSHIEHVVEDAIARGGGDLGTLGEGGVEVHAAAASATCPQIYQHAGEATWGCLLSGGRSAGYAEPIVAKVTDVNTMLLLSVIAAFLHLGIGLVIGVRNELGHGAKHVVAKFGWMVLLVTFFPAVVALLRPDMFSGYGAGDVHAALTFHIPATIGQAYGLAGIGFLVGAVVLGWAEGIVGVLEIPSMLSNILSYLRLGAVAIAKGAMAIAFNKLTLVDIGLVNGSAGLLVLAIIAFILVQMLLFVLGLLSAGIQAIRLNYVEFFTKFYKGGGEKFNPFGHVRRYSTVGPAVQGGGKL